MPAVIQPVSPGNPAYGIGYKPVTVVKVDTVKRVAITRDSYGQFEEVRCDLMKAKGNLPAPGEQWIIDRPYGQWMFGAILTGGTDGVIIPPENVTGLNDTLVAADTRVTNVADASLTRDNVLGGRATVLETNTTSQAVAKGDILGATAPGSFTRLPVGVTNQQVLVPDSTIANGLAWKTPLALPVALPGATAVGRYVGQTATGSSPTTGTFLAGDWIRDVNGYPWVCTAAGTPGTWVCNINNRFLTVEGNITNNTNSITAVANRATDLELSRNHSSYQNGASWGTGQAGIGGLGVFTNGGIATMTSYGCIPNRAGKWHFSFTANTNSGSSGLMVVEMRWSSGAFPFDVKNIVWRGGGFPGGGQIMQTVAWTGQVSAAQAAQGIFCWIEWVPATAGVGLDAGANRYLFEANYLGQGF